MREVFFKSEGGHSGEPGATRRQTIGLYVPGERRQSGGAPEI